MKIFVLSSGMLILLLSVSCSKVAIDDQKPVIDNSYEGAFPKACDTIWLGEDFLLDIKFTDNVELGAFSLDIHHNFDHHAHSTDIAVCDMDSIKSPVNPFLMIRDYPIPEGSTIYQAKIPVSIPQGNQHGSFDEGDYHISIKLTDKEGWSVIKGMNIKLLKR